MKPILKIFRQDVKSIGKNLIIFAVVIGITILPALYAWFNIAANWDPYSNTNGLSFAVCTLDKGFEYSGLTVNAGEKIKDNLKQNSQMGWVFVDDEEAAEEGVKNGTYYAAVIIPEDFSENLLSLLTGKFKQAKMHYLVNEKPNAVAPKITDKVIGTIEESADASYVSTLAETIASVLNVSSTKLDSEKETIADNITSALETAKTETESFSSSIDLLIKTLDSVDSLIRANQAMLPTIQSTLNKAGVAAGDIKNTLQGAKTTASQLTATIESLISTGSSYVDSASAELDAAFGTVSSDAAAIADKLSKVKTLNEKNMSVNNKIITALQTVQSSLGIDCSKAISRLNTANDKQQAIIDKVNSVCDTIEKTGAAPANAKAELDALVSAAGSELAGVENEFSAVRSGIDSALDKSFSDLDAVADFAESINLEDSQLNTAFKTGSETISGLKDTLNDLKTYFTKIGDKIDNTVERINELKSDDTLENMLLPIIEKPEELGAFLSSPVAYEETRINPIENYGSAMTPFYSSLALWVGGVVLVAVLNVDLTPSDRKKLGKANSAQLFFGRYLTFFIAGQLQALIIALGDLYFLKIQCNFPLLFILSCLISSFVYSLFIYSLTITFSVVGKALAVIVLILQVAGSGGTFPIEVLPAPYQALAPFLPFKYGINALRDTVADEILDVHSYLTNTACLLLFIVPALILGLLLRKPCIKAISFFNHKIEESDLII